MKDPFQEEPFFSTAVRAFLLAIGLLVGVWIVVLLTK